MEDYGGGGGGYFSSKRSGRIPAFGDWEYADDLPITQYFESARQAGLLNRYSSSSGECAGGGGSDDSRGYNKGDVPQRRHARLPGDPARKTRPTSTTDSQKQRRRPQVTGSDDRRAAHHGDADGGYYEDAVSTMPVRAARAAPKPVDEDLYKIPPELLRTTKRKKMLGFFSRCLVPGCAA